jgi:type IV pilus assembly protein PilF
MRLLWLLFVCSILQGCAPSPQSLKDQSVAQMDSELMVLDLQNQDLASARLHLNEAEFLAPRDPQVLIAAGYFDVKMGDIFDAQKQYNLAIALAPHDSTIENDYGTFLYEQGQYAEALPYFLDAAQNPANLVSAEAFENAGLSETKLDEFQLAQQDFMRAKEEDPSFTPGSSTSP